MNSQWQATAKAWSEFWFVPRDPSLISSIRVGAGLMAILHFVTLLYDGSNWLGPIGWLNVDAGRFLIGDEVDGTGSIYRWSLLYWYPNCVSWIAGIGILASAATVAGIGSRLSPFAVWFCMCTFHHRAPLITMLHEPMLVALMAYLSIDPGRTQWTLRPGFSSGKARISVNIAQQLIVCHFWIWIAFSLFSMLANSLWWNGEAGWLLMQQARGWVQLTDGWQSLGQLLTHLVIATQAASLFCMTQANFHWLGRWMVYGFLAAVLLLLADWMYAAVLLVASFAHWPIPIPNQKSIPN